MPQPSVTSNVDVKLWGRVAFVTTYDNFQGISGIGGADFQNYITREGDEELSFNGRDTRFGFSATSQVDEEWKGSAVMELDFYGSNSGANLLPRLRLGYAEVSNRSGFSLRCGQDWLPVAVQNPCTIDFGILAWSGNLWNRAPQLTARYRDDEFEFTLGAVHARVAGSQDQQERVPWVVGRVAWSGLGEGGLLAIGGGVRANTITPTTGASIGVPHDATNYLLALEAKLPVTSWLEFTGEAWTGAGIGADFLRGGLDYRSDGEPIVGIGGFVNAGLRFDERWSANVGIGIDQPHDRDTPATTAFGVAVPYDSNWTLFANVRYQLGKQLGMGVEVMDMHTELANGLQSGDDGSRLHGQRVSLGMWFTF